MYIPIWALSLIVVGVFVFSTIMGFGAAIGEDDYDVDDYEDFAPKKLKRYGKVYEIKEDA